MNDLTSENSQPYVLGHFERELQRLRDQANLPAPNIKMQTLVERAPHAKGWLNAVGHMVESLLPAMVQLGIATAEEVDLPALRERLWDDVRTADGLVIGRYEVAIWTQVD